MPGQRPSAWRALAAAARLTCKAAGPAMLAYCLVMVAQAAAPVAAAWSTKLMLESVVQHRATLAPVLVLAIVGACGAILPSVAALLNNIVGRATSLVATARLFEATDRQVGLARFEDPRFADRLRLAQQAAGSVGGLGSAAFGTGQQVLTLGGFVVSLTIISPVLTTVVLAAGVPVLIAQLRLARQRADMLYKIGSTERREFFYSQLLTTAQAAKEIRLFGIGRFLRERLLRERRAANAARLRMDIRETNVESGLGLLGAAVAGGGLVWAGIAASRGHLGVGDLTVLIAALASVQSGVYSLVSSMASAHQALLLFDHYVAVVRDEPDLRSGGAAAVAPLRQGIELRDVWFRYSEDHPWILRGVYLFLVQGASVALVGLNGAGKSTLVKLLCRFYDPDRGAILWDGVDIREIPADALRARISGVFQDHVAYDLTAAENVAVGEISALDDRPRIRRAAGHAGVDATLNSLPAGYDTVLSRMFFAGNAEQAGVILSGGQWQRVALARAFMRSAPDLVILDEPSSGLDAEAEHDIHTTMRQHRAGRTTLLISHRLNTVREAHLIVVLGDGAVVEQGTHDALISRAGEYARLFHLQAAGYQPAPGAAARLSRNVLRLR